MAWESAGWVVWESGGMAWESAGWVVWESGEMAWESAGWVVWESGGMVWESGSNQVGRIHTKWYTSHSHVQLVYKVSDFMRQRPAGLVHHKVAHTDDLSCCICPVQWLLVLLIWQHRTVTVVH